MKEGPERDLGMVLVPPGLGESGQQHIMPL